MYADLLQGVARVLTLFNTNINNQLLSASIPINAYTSLQYINFDNTIMISSLQEANSLMTTFPTTCCRHGCDFLSDKAPIRRELEQCSHVEGAAVPPKLPDIIQKKVNRLINDLNIPKLLAPIPLLHHDQYCPVIVFTVSVPRSAR